MANREPVDPPGHVIGCRCVRRVGHGNMSLQAGQSTGQMSGSA
ncbi:hypothetical protein APASM_4564 [Actinosynnema pretiosum subsp. pretiosum]|nr:hypothetical protein APASM_4564 [Actinosynnema pretiosum subsp. pretiosum]